MVKYDQSSLVPAGFIKLDSFCFSRNGLCSGVCRSMCIQKSRDSSKDTVQANIDVLLSCVSDNDLKTGKGIEKCVCSFIETLKSCMSEIHKVTRIM